MPWTVANPPNPVKNRPEREKRACVIAANDTLARGGSEAEAIQACVGAARKVRGSQRFQEGRLGKKARIKRASAAARERLPEIDAEAAAQLEAIYRRAADELDRRIRSLADPTDGTLRSWILPQLREQVGAVVSSSGAERDQVLGDFIDEAALIGAGALATAAAVDHVRVSEEAARFVRTFQAEDGLTLSDRLWRLDRGAQEVLEQHVQHAVVVGKDASQAAQEFLERGDTVPRSIRDRLRQAEAGRVAQSAAQRLMTGRRDPYSQALQVFRTEINRAHGEAYMTGAMEVEGVVGFRFLLSPNHPRPDICDMHARVDRHGLGPGVYPPGQVPWPAHPNTLSYIEAVFEDEIESEEVMEPIDWLKRQPREVQYGVLKAGPKVRALQRDLLDQSAISTPWRVLRERLARQGVDIAELENP